MTTTDLPWKIRGGLVISGSFITEREHEMAKAINQSASEAHERISDDSYRRGFEDAKALYEPRTWLGKLFG